MSAEPATGAVATLAAWHETLTEIGVLGDALGRAIESDDLIAAISTMMLLRRARNEVARIEPSTQGLDAVSIERMHQVRASLAKSHGVHGIMREWLSRDLPPDAELLASPLGVAVLADALLPASWDFERDLVLLIGAELAPVAHVLADLGQRRMLVLGEAELPPGVIRVQSVEELAVAIHTMTPMSPAQLTLRAAASADPELVQRCASTARDCLGDLRIHQNTVRSFSHTWIEQGTRNLPALARWPTVEDVGDALAGVPMVIVAPGPSLAKNVDQLRALRGRAVLCCFSHSLKPVLAAGCVPDLIVSVDPQDVRYHFAGCDVGGSYLVNGATVHPGLYELPARGVLTLASNGPLDNWLFEALGATPDVVGGGSVATTAFSLALRWRCDPIVFIGLDLSFPGGQYYVSTSSDGGARAVLDGDGKMRVAGWSEGFTAMKARGGPVAPAERVVTLAGWHGDTVPSSFSFAMFHRWFEETLRSVTAHTVLNCTEGGAWIAGMHHRPLAEVIPELRMTVDPKAVLDTAIAAVDRDRRRRALARMLRGHVAKLRRAKRLALHARDLAARPGTEHDLQRTERALAATLRSVEFASLVAQREVERALDAAAHHSEHAGYLAASSALFTTVIEVADHLVPILVAAQTGLED